MDKDKVIALTILSVGSFIAGVVVNEVIFNHRAGKGLSTEATVYLAAMDYVKTLNSGN